MNLRTIGLFLLACSAICFIVAAERYQSAVEAAKKMMGPLEGFEVDSVSLPLVSSVCGLAGVVLFVAGVRLMFEQVKANRAKSKDGMLKVD
ncbi:MAG: hypothetical protein AB8B55_01880 [Mariniblastus sp.]